LRDVELDRSSAGQQADQPAQEHLGLGNGGRRNAFGQQHRRGSAACRSAQRHQPVEQSAVQRFSGVSVERDRRSHDDVAAHPELVQESRDGCFIVLQRRPAVAQSQRLHPQQPASSAFCARNSWKV
jgi:hypothetical protein